MENFREPGAFELEQNAHEFLANIEAGSSGNIVAKVVIIGHPSESLIVAVANRERFQAKLRPNEDGTF